MPLPDFALCVGINRYPGLTTLRGAESDAQTFYDWVTSKGGVANAKLILSSQFEQTTEASKAKPTSQEIWDFFERLRHAASVNNANGLGLIAGRRLYLFFSGHGFSPSVDTSGILMANAERDTPHNLSAKAWADRFYENGLFEEIVLFQDACREQVSDVELTPPYLKKSVMGGAGARKRFYALAAKSPLLAIEKPIDGVTRGVFSATVMAALGGGAGDPQTGEITAERLKSYLEVNMVSRLEAADLENEDVCQRPEVFNPDRFVIVEGAAAAKFPVVVELAPPGVGAQILDGARRVVAETRAGELTWRTLLSPGLFELVVSGKSSRVFKVDGAIGPTGQPQVLYV